jgi:hypothetical protein
MPRIGVKKKLGSLDTWALNELKQRSMETGKQFRYSQGSRYESFAPRSYRSGKNCWRVGVLACCIAAFGADVGVGVDGASNGVLHGEHVRRAQTRKDQLARKKRSGEERYGMRAPARCRGGGVPHVLRP